MLPAAEMEACLSRNPYLQHNKMLHSWTSGKNMTPNLKCHLKTSVLQVLKLKIIYAS